MRSNRLILGLVFALGWGCTSGATMSPPSEPPPGPVADAVPITLVDGERSWNALGEPIGAHDALVSVPGHNAFWFAWSVFHPGTRVFGDDSPIEGNVPAGDEECTVPCDQIQPACSGRDCIPALTSPAMTDAEGATYLRDEDLVLGVITASGPRAYPHNILWWHEIVNEDLDGEAFTVTLCPLTGSGLRYDRRAFIEGQTVELGVSGSLYNSNLVMYDRTTESFWSQMRLEALHGDRRGTPAPLQPVYETTWGYWRAIHPDTRVLSEDTGHTRDYQRYPYGAYRTDDANTFRATDPPPDPRMANKDMVFGLVLEGVFTAYPWSALEATAGARQGVVLDEVAGREISIVFDLDGAYVHAFERGDTSLEVQVDDVP